MEIRRLSQSDGLPVSIDDLKLDLRIDDGDEDATLTRMAQTAAGLIERRSGYIIIPGEFEALGDCFDDWKIQRSPYRGLTSIEAMTGKNDWVAQDLDDFQVIERPRGFDVIPFCSFTRPTLYTHRNGVRLRFEVGFDVEGDTGFSGDDLPIDPTVRGVFIALTGHYYENRELFMADKLTEIESTSGGLLNSIRTFW